MKRYDAHHLPPPGTICGAKTRAGTPCKQRGIYDNGRCHLHGGLSTGPRTEAGKAAVCENLKKARARRHKAHEC